MKLYFVFTRKNLAVILAVIIAVFILIGQFSSVKSAEIDASTNAKRVLFLQGLGYEVDETATEIKDIVIPENFSAVYEKYNNLQKQAGFDLKNYRGKNAKVYSYSLQNDTEKQIHLIVCEDRLIGGDVASLKLNGNMTGLKRKNE
jgi:hypothetical protein